MAEAMPSRTGLNSPMLPRVVITGIGVVSPNGIGKEAFCRAILDGKSGVKRISRFDASCLPVQIAGEIPDFDEQAWVDVRERKHVSRVVPLAIAASTEAIGYAYQHIQAGVQPMFLVGGVDAPITPGIIKGYTLLRAMTQSWNHAPERASRPFSADRDGFVIAEGSWMFTLEDYEHARARGARIYAEIVGYAATCEAFHRVRMSDSPEEPARAITLALEEARLAPVDIQYVNLHGTSTEMNDRVETRALKLALGDHAYKVPMSALKSQIGHAQGACGSASVAAALVAMEHGRIPPTINLDLADPECDLDYVPDAGRRAAIEHAICNCVGFGSKNSALVLKKLP